MFSIETALAETLTQGELFLGGAIGGLAGFALAIALPYFIGLLAGQSEWPPSVAKMFGVVGVVLINMFMGGIAALIVGEATLLRQAIAFGFSWPAVLKGAGEGIERYAAAHPKGRVPLSDAPP